MTSTKEQTAALEELRAILPAGTTVRTILRHASKSGKTRWISLLAMENGEPRDITWLVSRATGDRLDERAGSFAIKIGGCGMDMGFALVYGLSRRLYPDGVLCTGDPQTCRSNDHSNDYGVAQHDFWQTSGEEPIYDRSNPDFMPQHRRMSQHIEDRMNRDLGYRPGRVHSDGGFALSQKWI